MKRILVTVLLLCGAAQICLPPESAAADYVNQLQCRGTFLGVPATLVGVRQVDQYSTGGYQVSFRGTVEGGGMRASLQYDGYWYVGLAGFMSGPLGTYGVAVIDDLNSTIVINEGAYGMRAPEEWGRFTCTAR